MNGSFKIKSDDEVRNQVRGYIEMAKRNQSVESDKLDFKRQWYNLKDDKDVMEIMKDTSAIANTPGGDGYIVLGVDSKGKIYDTTFSDSGLSDEKYFHDMFNKHMDTPFRIRIVEDSFNGKKYSILHIPPSNGKPHLIKMHLTYKANKSSDKNEVSSQVENAIFVRRGGNNRRPLRAEIEDIFRYRHEFVSDIDLIANANPATFHYNTSMDMYGNDFTGTIIIENIGYRPVTVEQIILTFEFSSNEYQETVAIKSYNRKIPNSMSFLTMVDNPIIIPSNSIAAETVGFKMLSKPQPDFGKFVRGGGFDAKVSIKITSLPKSIELLLNKA